MNESESNRKASEKAPGNVNIRRGLLEPPDNEAYISQAVEILISVIESQDGDIIIFTNGYNCIQSQEIQKVFFGIFGKELVDIVDARQISTNVEHFYEAIGRFTGSLPPVVFFKKNFIGNYSDIATACRFKRLDLLLEPPQCPFYHIIIIGGGHGAHSVVNEILEFGGTNLKIIMIESKLFLPPELEGKYKGRIPRHLAWKMIRFLQDAEHNPSKFYDSATYDESERQEDCSLRMLCEAANIEYWCGSVQFLSDDVIHVTEYCDNLQNGSAEDECIARTSNMVGMSFILCTGCQPLIPEFPGSEHCVTLEKFLINLPSYGDLPLSAFILGNTAEVLETAHMLSIAGGEVVVATGSKKWLPGLSKWYVKQILRSFHELKVTFMMIKQIIRIKVVGTKYKIQVRMRNGKQYYSGSFDTILADYKTDPICCTMDMEIAGIQMDKKSKRIIVDNHYKTANPFVYAFGNAAHGHPNNPKFEILAGRRLINIIVNGVDDVLVPRLYPEIILTPLEYSFCGESDKFIKKRGEHQKLVVNVAQNSSFHIKIVSCRPKRQPHSSYNKDDDQVLGVHILGLLTSTLISYIDSMITRGAKKGEVVDKFLKSTLLKELGIYRISFTSRKHGSCSLGQSKTERDEYSEDSDDESIYVKKIDVNIVPSPVKTCGLVIDEEDYSSPLPITIHQKLTVDHVLTSLVCLIAPFILAQPITCPIRKKIYESIHYCSSASTSSGSENGCETEYNSSPEVFKNKSSPLLPVVLKHPRKPVNKNRYLDTPSSKTVIKPYQSKERKFRVRSKKLRVKHQSRRENCYPEAGDAFSDRHKSKQTRKCRCGLFEGEQYQGPSTSASFFEVIKKAEANTSKSVKNSICRHHSKKKTLEPHVNNCEDLHYSRSRKLNNSPVDEYDSPMSLNYPPMSLSSSPKKGPILCKDGRPVMSCGEYNYTPQETGSCTKNDSGSDNIEHNEMRREDCSTSSVQRPKTRGKGIIFTDSDTIETNEEEVSKNN